MAQERTENMLKPGKRAWGRVMVRSKGGVCRPKWGAPVPLRPSLVGSPTMQSLGCTGGGGKTGPGVAVSAAGSLWPPGACLGRSLRGLFLQPPVDPCVQHHLPGHRRGHADERSLHHADPLQPALCQDPALQP